MKAKQATKAKDCEKRVMTQRELNVINAAKEVYRSATDAAITRLFRAVEGLSQMEAKERAVRK